MSERTLVSELRRRLALPQLHAIRGFVLTAALFASPFGSSDAVADTEHVSGSVTVDTPISSVPHPIFPIGTVIENFTSYGSPFPYVLGTFSVNLSGIYSANLITPSVQNGFYLLEGSFAPSLGTPSTPLDNFIAFTWPAPCG